MGFSCNFSRKPIHWDGKMWEKPCVCIYLLITITILVITNYEIYLVISTTVDDGKRWMWETKTMYVYIYISIHIYIYTYLFIYVVTIIIIFVLYRTILCDVMSNEPKPLYVLISCHIGLHDLIFYHISFWCNSTFLDISRDNSIYIDTFRYKRMQLSIIDMQLYEFSFG